MQAAVVMIAGEAFAHATGAMMLGTLLDELERRDLHRGIVSAAGAAGSGSALLIERLVQ